MLAVVSRSRTPLIAVNVSKIAVLVGPLVPYPHTIVLQVFHVCVAVEEPQELVNNRFQVQFFCGEAGESLLEVKTHLVAEHANGACAGPVFLFRALGEYSVEQV